MSVRQSPLLENSVRVYQVLLYLYPKEHRDEYGWLMVQFFRDKAYDAYIQDGDAGIILHWLASLLDLFISVVNERREKGFTMSFNILEKVRSPLMMLGGFFVTLNAYYQLKPGFWWQNNRGLYALAENLMLPGVILFAMGLFLTLFKIRSSLKVRNRSQTMMLVAGIVLLLIAGFISAMMLIVTVISDWNNVGDITWGLFLLVFSGLCSSLILLAIVLFRSGQRWSLVLAIHPVWFFGFWIRSSFVEYVDTRGPLWGMFFWIAALGIVWIVAGYQLRGDIKFKVSEKTKTHPGGDYNFDKTV